jgi:YbaB/EbfC DNA-binding family
MSDEAEALAASVAARIGCIRAAVDNLQRRLPCTDIRVSSACGEVVVSVDRHGRLVALQLASGATARLTCEVLEFLINATLRRAVDLAVGAKRSHSAG